MPLLHDVVNQPAALPEGAVANRSKVGWKWFESWLKVGWKLVGSWLVVLTVVRMLLGQQGGCRWLICSGELLEAGRAVGLLVKR